MVSMEEQRLYTKGLEGDLQQTRQRLINAESTVKATKRANESMQATIVYWSSFYAEENVVPVFANPTDLSSTILSNIAQLPSIPEYKRVVTLLKLVVPVFH